MPMLEWSDALSIRVADVDEEHKRLVDMVNVLHDAMVGGAGEDALRDIVNAMREYSETHFATEERYMERYGYPDPDARSHKDEHKEFMDKAVAIEQDCKTDCSVLTMDVLNYLCDWLVTHIDDVDKKLGQYLNGKGVH